MATYAPFGSAKLSTDTGEMPESSLAELASQGLRTGGIEARGQLNKLAGTALDYVRPGLGAGRQAAAADDQRLAAEAGQGLVPITDVNGIRSAGRYAAGALGRMAPLAIPAIGAGLLTGGGAVPAMLAGAAATAPFNVGGQLQRQDEDPANAGRTPGERLGAAIPAGVGAALLENIIPGGVAARMAGRGGTAGVRSALLRGGLDIPANAAASGLGEGVRQLGDQQLNPNARFDTHTMGMAALEGGAAGAAFGGLGAAGHALHAGAGSVGRLPGRAIDAVKGLMPERAEKAPVEAPGNSAGAPDPVLDWTKNPIADRIADVATWAKDFLNDPETPANVKAQVQDVLKNPGDKVKGAWLYAQKLARDGMDKAIENDVPGAAGLNKFYADSKDKARALMDRMAKGEDIVDPAAPDQAGAQAKADQTTFEAATKWANDLAKEKLGPEKTAELQAAMSNLKDKTNQQRVAAMKVGQDALSKVREFGKAVGAKADEVDASKGVKKSLDFSDSEKKIGRALVDAIGPEHPLLQTEGGVQELARAMRPAIKRIAEGNWPTEKELNILRDAIGADKMTAVFNAASDASGVEHKDQNAFYDRLNAMDTKRTGREAVVDVMSKSLRPELQGAVHSSELHTEADMLHAWATRKLDKQADTPKAQFEDRQVRQALETRYGNKAGHVLDTVEKNLKQETNVIDAAETSERTTEDGQSSVKYFPQNKQLYEGPETAKGKKGFDSAVVSRLKTAQKENPDAAVRFVKVSELDKEDPKIQRMIEAKRADLIDEAQANGMDREEAEAHAAKKLDNFGIVVAEASKQETALTTGDMKAVSLNAKKYGDSPARIDLPDGTIVDAVKLTDFMNRKLSKPDDWLEGEVPGSRARLARMFKEGVAALTDRAGENVKVPDSTVISKDGMTWGEAQKLKAKPIDDQARIAKQIEKLREEYRAAKTEEERDAIAAKGKDLSEKLADPVAYEQARERTSEDGDSVDEGKPQSDPFSRKITDLKGEAPADATIRTNLDGSARDATLTNSRTAPATPDGEAKRVAVKDAPIKPREATGEPTAPAITKAQGDAARDAQRLARKTEGRGITKVGNIGGPPSPKALAAKQAALLKAASSSDPALLKELRTSNDAKGLQRAAELLAEHGESKALDTVNQRISELIQNPDVAYGLQTKRYSLMSTKIHEDLERPGFAATHDSPVRHAGEFDWRTHKGKGEGNASFGAGTYLSTAEGVHKSYKGQFTAKVERDAPQSKQLRKLREAVDDNSDSLLNLMQERDELGKWRADVGGRVDHFPTQEAARAALDDYRQRRIDRVAELKQRLVDKVNSEGREYNIDAIRKDIKYIEDKLIETDGNQPKRVQDLIDETTEHGRGLLKEYEDAKAKAPELKSPTYHVSVDIPPEQLLDWDKPLSEQSRQIREAMKKLGVEGGRELDWWPGTNSGSHTAFISNGSQLTVETKNGPAELYIDGKLHGSFSDVDEAKDAALRYAAQRLSQHEVDALGFKPLTGAQAYRQLTSELGSQRKASEALQAAGILGHKYAASGGWNDAHPNYVIYDDSKISTNYVHFSQQRTTPGAQGPVDRVAVERHIEKVLGPDVMTIWSNIMHAGEFERTNVGDVIRLSVHSLNPMSAAYHESLHGFMARLRDAKEGDAAKVLMKAGESAPIMNQLKRLLANEPDALKQLRDPEERAAYMYQFWAQGKLNVGDGVKTVFGRIAEFLRQVTGLWSNDQHALHIMEYFHSGEYQANRSDPNAVHQALQGSSSMRALARAKAMTTDLRNAAEALGSAGGTRLRDTGIPALRELADAMKLKTTTEGEDAGYLPVARAERSRVLNEIGAELKPYSKAQISEALDAMQRGVKAATPEGRLAARTVQKRLDGLLKYMQDAGVDVKAIGAEDGVPYFPRSWDSSHISSNQAEFLAMLQKYKDSGQLKSDPKALMQKLMVTDGAEFNVEVDKPGMQFAKERTLKFISHEDAAPFMRKDLLGTLNNYVTQATRRAEWARRFGDKGEKITELLDRAKAEGADEKQLDLARKFIRAVDGTLGDTLDPGLRRLQGNMIVYQNLRLLPLAIFSSAVDPQGIMVRGGTVGDAFKTFKRGMTEVVKNFQKEPKSDKMTELAEAIGTVDNAMLVRTLGASYSQGMVGDRGRAINDTYFRFNLMEQYNTSMRVGATEAALKFLVKHATKPGEHSERFLNELGLKASDVMVNADGSPKLFEHEGLSLEHAAKMKAAVNRWVDGAILRPDAVDKTVWMSDPHFALVAHLKQFVYSFHETILKRVAHEAQHGNYAPAMSLASYVPTMMAADMLKGMIQGGGEEPSWKASWGPSDYVWSSLERSGVFGTGQFVLDALGDIKKGGVGVGALVGPTIEQLTDAIRVSEGVSKFGNFAIKSMPANALYATYLHGEATDPKFAD